MRNSGVRMRNWDVLCVPRRHVSAALAAPCDDRALAPTSVPRTVRERRTRTCHTVQGDFISATGATTSADDAMGTVLALPGTAAAMARAAVPERPTCIARLPPPR